MDFSLSLNRIPSLSDPSPGGLPPVQGNSTNAGMLYKVAGAPIRPSEWCGQYRACWVLGGGSASNPVADPPGFVFSQPSSTFFVMLLAFICMGVGVRLLASRRDDATGQLQFSRVCWGIGMLLWGVGAFLAGLSYEALEWELKCRGRDFCILYSWMEMVYVVYQVAAINFLAVGESLRVMEDAGMLYRVTLFSMFNFIVYSTVSTVGALTGIEAFLSFTLVEIFGLPAMALGVHMSFSAWQEAPKGERLQDGNHTDSARKVYSSMFYTWLMMIASGVAYAAYEKSGLGDYLWEKHRISFTGNHVLHIVLIVWAVMVGLQAPHMRDGAALRRDVAEKLYVSPTGKSARKPVKKGRKAE